MAVGAGVLVGRGVAVGAGVGVGVAVGKGVAVGTKVGVGVGSGIGVSVAVGAGVAVGVGVAVAVGRGVAVVACAKAAIVAGMFGVAVTRTGSCSCWQPKAKTATRVSNPASKTPGILGINLAAMACSTVSCQLGAAGHPG